MSSIMGIQLPFSFSFSGVFNGITKAIGTFFTLMLIILILAGIGLPLYFHFLNKKKYFIKIPIYAKVNNKTMKVDEDIAMEFNASKTGDKLIFWKNKRIYKFFPQHASAKDTYPYFRRTDGEYVNFEIEDINEATQTAKVKFTPSNLRAERISVANIIKDHYETKDWLKEHPALILGASLVIIILVGGWFISDKLNKIADNLAETSNDFKEASDNNLKVQALYNQFLTKTDTSGLKPAT